MTRFRGLRADPTAPIDVDYKVSSAYLQLFERSPKLFTRASGLLGDWCLAHADFQEKHVAEFRDLTLAGDRDDAEFRFLREGQPVDMTYTEDAQIALSHTVRIDAAIKARVWEEAGSNCLTDLSFHRGDGQHEFKFLSTTEQDGLMNAFRLGGNHALFSYFKGLPPFQARELREAARKLRESDDREVNPRYSVRSLEELDAVIATLGWHDAGPRSPGLPRQGNDRDLPGSIDDDRCADLKFFEEYPSDWINRTEVEKRFRAHSLVEWFNRQCDLDAAMQKNRRGGTSGQPVQFRRSVVLAYIRQRKPRT